MLQQHLTLYRRNNTVTVSSDTDRGDQEGFFEGGRSSQIEEHNRCTSHWEYK